MTQHDIAEALNGMDPKAPFSGEFHNALLRFIVSVVVEAIALKEQDGKLYARLRKRTDDEPAYPGYYHFPGSFYRVGEDTPDVIARIAKNELGARITSYTPITHLIRTEERGTVCSLLHLVTLEDDTHDELWFPIDELPEPMVEDHRTAMLPLAIAAFRNA